jgi:hypothetical protein
VVAPIVLRFHTAVAGIFCPDRRGTSEAAVSCLTGPHQNSWKGPIERAPVDGRGSVFVCQYSTTHCTRILLANRAFCAADRHMPSLSQTVAQ